MRVKVLLVLALVCASCGGGGSGSPAPPVSAGCGPYPDQATSPYVLPYEAGSSYRVSLYFHLAQNGAMVILRQVVQEGDVIALSGNSGNSTEPHLHFVVGSPPGSSGAGSLPVTFNNKDPHPNGLVSGRS